MFAYCGNSPNIYSDCSGRRYQTIQFGDDGIGLFIPEGSNGFEKNKPLSGRKHRIPDLRNFALLHEETQVSHGKKIAEAVAGGFDAYSFSDGKFELLSGDLSLISLDVITDDMTWSLFDIGNLSASLGIAALPYGSMMVSLWDPSISFEFNNHEITFTAHIGAFGFEADPNAGSTKIGFAKGFGFSYEIS